MPDHGTRACYQQQACRCTPCRAANATYQADLRKLKAQGKQPAGATIRAVLLWQVIRRLKKEHLTQRELAQRLGFKAPQLQFSRTKVRRITAAKVGHVLRALMAEGDPDV